MRKMSESIEAWQAVRAINRMTRIMNTEDLTWEEKFEAVFALNRQYVMPALHKYHIRLEYYDPDTTAEEDTRALCQALEPLRPKFEFFSQIERQLPL